MHNSGKNDRRGIVRAMSLILQLGLCVMVPLFLGVGIGLWLDGITGSHIWTLVLAGLGLLGGVRSAYVLAGRMIGKDTKESEEYDLMSGWEEDASSGKDGDE